MSDMKLKLIHDESGLAFPTIIGLFCIFLGLALWMLLDEVITPMQDIYVNTSYAINATMSYNATTTVYSGYLNQGWKIVPFILMLLGVIYLLVNSQKEQ